VLISERVDIKIFSKNLQHYINKGYDCKVGDFINIDVKDLPKYSICNIEVMCDNCKITKFIKYADFLTSNKNNIYHCYNCRSIRNKQTNIKKYGVSNVFQLDDIKEKSKQTNLKKRGVEFASQCLETKNKKIETNKKIYGTNYATQNINVKNKIIETCKKRYNVNYSFLNDEVKNRIKKTLNENYGEDNPMKSEIIKKRSSNTRVENLLKKYDSNHIINVENNIYEFKCDCGKDHNFKLTSTLLYNRLKYKTKLCTICNPINSYNNSGFQIELNEFIKNNFNLEISLNDRNIIKPYELDIYLSELKIAFEFNGIYWHSELYKSNNYHFKKTELCEKKGIRLIHIYEDDWLNKRKIIEHMILNLLGKLKEISHDNCEIKEIYDNDMVKEFLENNHIQGFEQSEINIGLFYNNEMISLMTFTPLKNENFNDNSFEILRFCDKVDMNNSNSSGLLFKYFIHKYLYYFFIKSLLTTLICSC
jgi:hypothetical protein